MTSKVYNLRGFCKLFDKRGDVRKVLLIECNERIVEQKEAVILAEYDLCYG